MRDMPDIGSFVKFRGYPLDAHISYVLDYCIHCLVTQDTRTERITEKVYYEQVVSKTNNCFCVGAIIAENNDIFLIKNILSNLHKCKQQ